MFNHDKVVKCCLLCGENAHPSPGVKAFLEPERRRKYFFFWYRSKIDSRKKKKKNAFLEEFIFQAIDINVMHGWRAPVVEQLNYVTVDLTKKS